ncbi:DUF89 family protein [Candidatus Desantisbacteria bacterium]|nr:DUF89 family protein [Candidatus Desantisbacteria bacterium]
MHMEYFCINCLSSQITEAIEMVIPEWEKRRELMRKIVNLINKNYPEIIPAFLGSELHCIVRDFSGRDPYMEIKKISNSLAKEVINQVGRNLSDFRSLVLACIASNAIDFGISTQKDAMYKLQDIINEPLVIDNYNSFYKQIKKAKTIIYLVDNCGEVVFDLAVIKMLSKMDKHVFAVAKEKTLLNDATVQDLKELGFNKYSTMISHGLDLVGLNRKTMSKQLKIIWSKSDLIIAKGMGYYETLYPPEKNEKIAFLLKAKCKPVAYNLKVEVGANVLLFP